MRDIQILQDTLQSQCPTIHKKRLHFLILATKSSLDAEQIGHRTNRTHTLRKALICQFHTIVLQGSKAGLQDECRVAERYDPRIVQRLVTYISMTKARSSLISIDATPYYHCVSRCVRRSFLCGYDELAKQNYEHRRGWIEERLLALAGAFCIDICAYAIMSNHYHVVLHINADKSKQLTAHDVAERWLAFHQGPTLIHRFLAQDTLTDSETERCHTVIETWRERLMSISWFMRLLNQHIASEANREDKCTGHFWEGRFKSQALLDEKALAAAMAYVDLNPVRAAIAATPETSDFTSIKARINAIENEKTATKGLFPFVGNPRENMSEGIPFRLMDYLELVDWTGRQCREDKRGQIDSRTPPILNRLGFDSAEWLDAYKHAQKGTLIGTKSSIKRALSLLGRKRLCGFRLPAS